MSRSILDRRVNQHRMPDGKGQRDPLQWPEAVRHPDFVRACKCRGSQGTGRLLQTLVAPEWLRSSLLIALLARLNQCFLLAHALLPFATEMLITGPSRFRAEEGNVMTGKLAAEAVTISVL